MTKEARKYEGKAASLINVTGKTGQLHEKNQTGLVSHTIYKNKFKQFKDLNVRPETIKFIEDNIGSMLFDMSLSNILLDMSPQARATKAKKQRGLHQTKNFCTVKNCQQNEKAAY